MAQYIVDSKGNPIKYHGKELVSFDIGEVVKTVDPSRRTLTMTGSTEDKDREGDIIMQKGWELENYQKNPVFLWAHDYRSVPIGAAIKVVKGRNPIRLDFTVKFPTEGLYPFADMVLALYAEKVINASSVGFIPLKWEPIEQADEEKKPGELHHWNPRRFVKQELLELSGCAVPSNPGALQNAVAQRSFGGVEGVELIKFVEAQGLPEPDKIDDVLEEIEVSKLDIVDESKIAVQVPDDLEEKDEEFETAATKRKRIEIGGDDESGDEEKGEEISEELVEKPYPNEHACRLKQPGQYDEFRRITRTHDGKQYSVIRGKKGDNWEDQAFRYPKDVWTVPSARAHCKDHEGISFEPAKESIQEDEVNNDDFNQRLIELLEGLSLSLKSVSDENATLLHLLRSIKSDTMALVAGQAKVANDLSVEDDIVEGEGDLYETVLSPDLDHGRRQAAGVGSADSEKVQEITSLLKGALNLLPRK